MTVRSRIRKLGLVCVLVLVSGAWAVHAQEDGERARGNAQVWLLKELNKPGLTLIEYSYEGTEWPDSGLGCPAPGATVTPGVVPGYRFFFLFDNRVRYEVHTNLDGIQAVLCSSVNVAPDVRLSAYTVPEFTILAPEAWLVFPNTDSTLFGPQQQTACSLPGMRIWVLGRVASGVTPDQLIDEFLAEIEAQDNATQRTSIESTGRTTTFEQPCDPGVQGWRVSAFVYFGSGYRIAQWAPQDEFGQWDPYFQNIVNQFRPAEALAVPDDESATETAAESSSGAQPIDPGTLAGLPLAHVFAGDVFIGALNNIPGRSVTTVPDTAQRYLTFSPDGLQVAFINQTTGQLRAVDVAAGLSARKMADSAHPAFPPAWSPDGQRIAYVGAAPEDAASLDIYAIPAAGGDPEKLATFPFTNTCTDTPTDAADPEYFFEAGPRGRDNVLAWLATDQFLVSTRCDGGLGLLNLTDGQITALGDDLTGGALAPDRMRFAARTPDGLAVLDFQSWQRTNFALGPDVRQVAWAVDGSALYFSVETLADSQMLESEADRARGEVVFGFWPVTVSAYNLKLARLDLGTSQENLLWKGQGRGLGRITPAPDGSGVLFCVVPGGARLAEAFRTNADGATLRAVRPAPALYWLAAGETTARLLAYSSQPVFAPITLVVGSGE